MASSTADPVEWVTMKAAQNPPDKDTQVHVLQVQLSRVQDEAVNISWLLGFQRSISPVDPQPDDLSKARHHIRALEARVKQIREWIDALT